MQVNQQVRKGPERTPRKRENMLCVVTRSSRRGVCAFLPRPRQLIESGMYKGGG